MLIDSKGIEVVMQRAASDDINSESHNVFYYA